MTTTQDIERRIVRRLVKDVLATGRSISVSLERGYDLPDGEGVLASTIETRIMAEAFAGDEAHLFIHEPGVAPLEDGEVVCLGWVFIVLGNDGPDVICDYTTNLEDLGLMRGAEELADRYEEEL